MSLTITSTDQLPAASPPAQPPPAPPMEPLERSRRGRRGAPDDRPVAAVIEDADRAYQAALAAAEAEEQAAAAVTLPAESQPVTPPAVAPTTPAQRAAQPANPSGDARMIPQARLNEVLARVRKAEADVAYWKGIADARAQMVAAGAQRADVPQAGSAAPPSAPTAADVQALIVAEQQKLIEAATRFDQGEITFSDFTKVQIDIGNEIGRLRATLERPVQASGIADQHLEQALTQRLEAQYPWSKVLPLQELQVLARMVFAGAESAGSPIQSGTAGNMRLRTEVAKLAQMYGPMWHPDWVSKVPAPALPKPAQAAQPPRQPAPTGALPGMDKLAAAASHPPDTSGIGTGAPPQTGLSNAQIMSLTAEDWAQLPPVTRARLLETG